MPIRVWSSSSDKSLMRTTAMASYEHTSPRCEASIQVLSFSLRESQKASYVGSSKNTAALYGYGAKRISLHISFSGSKLIDKIPSLFVLQTLFASVFHSARFSSKELLIEMSIPWLHFVFQGSCSRHQVPLKRSCARCHNPDSTGSIPP